MTSGNAEREREIWRDFRQAQGHAMARRWRENPPVDMGMTLLTFLSLLLICLTDPVVWWGLAPDFFFPVPPLRLFLTSLLFLPFNGWLGHTHLVQWTPQDQDRPKWLRVTRFALASLFPFGGLAIVPFWREVLRRKPDWIRPRDGRPVPLTLRGTAGRLPRRPALDRLHRSEVLRISLSIGSALPFFLGGLMAADPEGPLGQPGAIAFNLGLHVVAFLGMSHMVDQFLYMTAGSRWAWLLARSRWALIFPTPVCATGLLIIVFAVFGPLRGTWISGFYSQRFDALRFPLWRQAGQAFRPSIRGFSWADLTGRPPAPEPQRKGQAASRREALVRLTLLFLPPEAGLLTWYVLSAGGWQPEEPALRALLIGALGLALASLLLQVVPGAAEKLRWDRARSLSPYLRSGDLFLPAAGCLLGILGGLGAARGDLQLVGLILDLFVLSLALFGAAYALRGFVTNRFDLGLFVTWGFLYAALATLAILLKTAPDLAHRAVPLVLLAHVLNLAAGLALMPALLRPFTWRHTFDRQLPFRFRAALAIIVLAAILPLGGLAIPFWVWARQFLWQRHQHVALD